MRAQRTWTGEVPIHNEQDGVLQDTRHFEVMPRIGDTIRITDPDTGKERDRIVVAVLHSNEHFSRTLVRVQ